MGLIKRKSPPVFDESATTEAAVYLLKKSGGEAYFIKLLKLLYIADRISLLRWKQPITYDQYVSMDHGPVLSRTYSIINESYDESSVWKQHISERSEHKVRLLHQDAPFDPDWLSESEIEILNEVYDTFGEWDRWDLCRHTHTFAEWSDPQGSMVPIAVEDIIGRETDEQKDHLKSVEYLISARNYLTGLAKQK
ncbi:MAG: Panacea domain-containing protein [Bacteroidota bacterium]